MDRDHTGKISAQELQGALTNSNWSKFNIETCKLMVGMFDRDRSGQIDINEFQALWTYIHQWKAIFDQFDSDRSGSIDCNELQNAWTQLGYRSYILIEIFRYFNMFFIFWLQNFISNCICRLSPQFARDAVLHFDMTGQNKINFDAFIHSCVIIKQVTDKFRTKVGGIWLFLWIYKLLKNFTSFELISSVNFECFLI